MSALSPAEVQISLHHFLDHITVAHFGANHFAASGSDRLVESEIAHHRGDERVLLQLSRAQKIDSGNGENFIAIDNFAIFIAKKNAIGVAVVSNADVRATFFDDALDLFRMRAAAFRIDVGPVRLVMRHDHFRAELAQNTRGRFVSGAIGNVDRDAHLLERHSARKTSLGELDVAAKRVVNALGAPNFLSGRTHRINFTGKNKLLDFFFDLIVKLVAVVPEKLDAVVFVGVVRSGKDDASIGAERARNIGNARCGQWADDQNIDTERSDSGNERVLEHVTREARVLAEHDLWSRPLGAGARIQLREDMRGGAAQFQRGFGCDWLHVSDAADAVSSENLFGLHWW